MPRREWQIQQCKCCLTPHSGYVGEIRECDQCGCPLNSAPVSRQTETTEG